MFKEPMSMEELEKAYARVRQMRAWCKDVETQLFNRLQGGEKSSCYKIVSGRRGDRRWTNVEEVSKVLKGFKRDDFFEVKPLTPPKLEKLLAKDSPEDWRLFTVFIEQPEGKPVLAPMDDPREAIQITHDEFEQM